MRFVLLLISIAIVSCNNNKNTTVSKVSQYDSILAAENFDTTIAYSETSCLHYKGKPLFIFGQSTKLFDTSFSFRIDPNGPFQNYFMQGITDYLSLEDFYNVELSTGDIQGALYFSADNQKRIFKFAANFSIGSELVDTSGMEILGYLQEKYFPCFQKDIKVKQAFELKHESFVEQFHLYPPLDSAYTQHGSNPRWLLEYTVKAVKKQR